MNDNQTQNLPEPKNEIVVYQPDETIRLAVRLENETVWLTQSQLCELFQRDVSVISFPRVSWTRKAICIICKLQPRTDQWPYIA